MNTWFTADTHFGHKNIIKYTDRPYASTLEMDEALIANWNARVRPEDHVYHLGDFALNSPEECRGILERLNGNIHLIRGNHEKTADACADAFVWSKNYYELLIDDPDAYQGKQAIMLFHYAMRVWNGSHHGTWKMRAIDVGVDVHGLAPVSYAEVKAIMAKKNWISPFANEGK